MWQLLLFLAFSSITVNAVLPDNIVPRLIFYARPAIIPDEPSIQIHLLRYITWSWFEAWAACNDTAVGPLYLGTLRRTNQAVNCTLPRKNTAYAYAAYRILSVPLYADFQANFNAMMAEFELDPNNTSNDTSTPIGLGNFIGYGLLDFQSKDGFNSKGDLSANPDGGNFYGFPYSDYTSYFPAQTTYNLQYPDRWQPLVERRDQGNGPFMGGTKVYGNSGIQGAQTYATPHLRYTKAFGFKSPVPFMQNFSAVFARYSGGGNARKSAYLQQAADIISIQANLTDLQKVTAEYFESKSHAFGVPLPFLATVSRGTISGQTPWTVDDFVVWEFLINQAVWDSVIVAWSVKRKRDAVRPITAVRFLYGDKTITSWGGPGKGNIVQSGAGFRGWLRTMAHSEYPSGSACMCAAFAEANRQWYGSDNMFGYSFLAVAKSSGIEPGVVPAVNTTLGPFATFTQYANLCGESRRYGGVHFQQSVVDSLANCPSVSKAAADLWRQYLAGTVTTPVSPDDRPHFVSPDYNVGTDAALDL
jgi:hypothetical protein